MTKLEVGKTYKNRRGNDVRIIATDRIHSVFNVIGLMMDAGKEEIQAFLPNGLCRLGQGLSPYDIVDVEERFLNLYKIDSVYGPMGDNLHDTLSAAKHSGPLAKSRLKLTFTDGVPTAVELLKGGA